MLQEPACLIALESDKLSVKDVVQTLQAESHHAIRFGCDCWLVGISGLLIGLPWIVDYCGPLGTIGWAILIGQTRPIGQANARAIARHSGANARRQAFRVGWLFFIAWAIAFGIAYHWVPSSLDQTSHLGKLGSSAAFLMLMVWESIPFAIAGFSLCLLRQQWGMSVWTLIPILVSLETWWPKVFSSSIAHPYLDYLPVMQVAEFGGTPAVAAVVMAIHLLAARLLEWWRSNRCSGESFSDCAIAAIVLTGLFTWGTFRMLLDEPSQKATPFRVALIQTDPSVVESSEKLTALSDGVKQPVDLFLWPESAIGVYDERLRDFRDELRTIEWSEAPNPAPDPYPNNRAYLLAGGKSYGVGGRNTGPYRNNAYLIDPEKRIVGWTSKRTLMPIGEYVPFESWFPWFREVTAINTELVRGSDNRPLVVTPSIRIGALVCYEDMDSSVAAAATRSGATVLAALINAEAFKNPTTQRQHLRLAQLRSIENRRWFLRCSSTGVTCVISPTGRMMGQLPIGPDGALVASVYPREQRTVFALIQPWWNFFVLMSIPLAIGIELKLRPGECSSGAEISDFKGAFKR